MVLADSWKGGGMGIVSLGLSHFDNDIDYNIIDSVHAYSDAIKK